MMLDKMLRVAFKIRQKGGGNPPFLISKKEWEEYKLEVMYFETALKSDIESDNADKKSGTVKEETKNKKEPDEYDIILSYVHRCGSMGIDISKITLFDAYELTKLDNIKIATDTLFAIPLNETDSDLREYDFFDGIDNTNINEIKRLIKFYLNKSKDYNNG